MFRAEINALNSIDFNLDNVSQNEGIQLKLPFILSNSNEICSLENILKVEDTSNGFLLQNNKFPKQKISNDPDYAVSIDPSLKSIKLLSINNVQMVEEIFISDNSSEATTVESENDSNSGSMSKKENLKKNLNAENSLTSDCGQSFLTYSYKIDLALDSTKCTSKCQSLQFKLEHRSNSICQIDSDSLNDLSLYKTKSTNLKYFNYNSIKKSIQYRSAPELLNFNKSKSSKLMISTRN